MNTVIGVVVIAVGLLAVLANKRFGDASVDTTRSFFRLNPEGKSRTFMIVWSRAVAVIVGSGMVIGGIYFIFAD
jgi:hypothetical protein